MIDVFYEIGTGSKWGNKELMYSLRSLEKFGKNIKDVYIVGYKPNFINDNIKWIDAKDINTHPCINHLHKIKTFFEKTNIDRAFYMMDDIFFTKDVDFDNYPYYYKGILTHKLHVNAYHETLNNTLKELEKLNLPKKNFEVHCPFIYEKDKFLTISNLLENFKKTYRRGIQPRSLYANYYNIKGVYTDDVKIYRTDMPNPKEKLNRIDCFSINDEVIRLGINKILEQKYPEKSKYEK